MNFIRNQSNFSFGVNVTADFFASIKEIFKKNSLNEIIKNDAKNYPRILILLFYYFNIISNTFENNK